MRGGLTSIIYGYFMTKKWDAGFTTNGFLAGLVAITCPCYWVSPTGAVLLGGIAGVLVILGVDLLEWLRIDDPIGAVPVHGFCGIWGTFSLGLFAVGKYGATGPISPDNSAPLKGLFYGGGTQLLVAQVDRQRVHHPRYVRGGDGRDVCGQRNGNAALAGRSRTVRHGSARARYLGISGVRDLAVCALRLAWRKAPMSRC